MKEILLLIGFYLLIGNAVYSQQVFEGEEKEVHDVIIKLFDGMRQGDSSMVHDTFLPDVLLHTVAQDPKGKPIFHEGSLQQFLNAVGTPHDEIWDEPIWNTEIQIDGRLAQVWTDYAFYVGNQFSHCGVDAFTLYKTDSGWKIFQLADTRRKQDCDIPDYISDKRK